MAKSSKTRKDQLSASLAGTLSAFDTESDNASQQLLDQKAHPSQETVKSETSQHTAAKQRTKPSSAKKPKATSPTGDVAETSQGVAAAEKAQDAKTYPSELSNDATIYELFTAWLADNDHLSSNPDALQNFIQNIDLLSRAEFSRFWKQLRRHCSNFGYELDWLFEETLHPSPLRSGLGETVVGFVTNYQISTQLKAGTAGFRTYLAWRETPGHRKYQTLNRQLAVNLMQKEIIPRFPETIFQASNQVQNGYIRQVLVEASEHDLVSFLDAMTDVHR